MELPSLPRLLVLSLATLGSLAIAEDIDTIRSEAERAYVRGDLTEAKAKFERVLRASPTNRTAISYLRLIAAHEAQAKSNRGPATLQPALSKLIVEKVDFREANLADVLEYLKQRGTQLGNGNLPINFVLKLDESAKNTKITIALSNAPYTEVLRYIGELANVQFSYEPFAIVVSPKGAPQAAPPAETAGAVKIQGL